MKTNPNPHRRAFAALVPTLILLAAPAVAQEVQPAAPPTQTVAPPPVVRTITPAPAPAAVAPPAVTTTVAEPAPEAAPARAVPRAARAAPARSQPRAASPVARPAAPVAVAPAAAPVQITPAPVAEAPVAMTPTPEVAAPAATPAETPINSETATTQAAPVWPWVAAILAALVLVGGLLMMRRRRRAAEDEYYEDDYAKAPAAAEPAFVAPIGAEPGVADEPQFLRTVPLATAPIAAAAAASDGDSNEVASVEAELADPDAGDVAALTAADGPANRPWLEFAMRPVRAGSNDDDALVEIELTVGNSGSVAAKDVRISTFMFASDTTDEAAMERLLLDHRAKSDVTPMTIEPGEGTRIDATLSLPRNTFGEEVTSFNPVVIADARYRLPDGSEGRTSASFTIGMPNHMLGEGEDMRPIAIHSSRMVDDIEARLHGVPEHA